VIKKENIAFVVGNGTSRQQINLNHLKEFGPLYGCNAIYRDIDPDFLISVDSKMLKEIIANNVHSRIPVWTNNNPYSRTVGDLHFFPPNMGWSSGPSALWLASEHGYQKIYVLGFDYTGIGNNNESVNNVYTGTLNYKKENEKATYHGNWARQTAIIIQKYSKIKYVRVTLQHDSYMPDAIKMLPNIVNLPLEEFRKFFKF